MKTKVIGSFECRLYIGSIYEDTGASFYERKLIKEIHRVQDSFGKHVPLRITRTTFVCAPKYIEDGWEIAAINYPRAKTDPEIIEDFMEMLAEDFLVTFQQKRITLVTPAMSIMYESEAPYMPQAVS
tara:strand:- start:1324 stop:1704 length:381 start_codon:yes stop_codon:yes gene_type:complete